MLVFVDGNDLRATEVTRILPGLALAVEALQTGFSTSAPEPSHRARDKLLAHPSSATCFSEAVDIVTLDGKSLRLELDSENANRFCKYWRETPTRMHVAVAVRRAGSPQVTVFEASCTGQIAAQPAGPLVLGWDRLFVPDGASRTLAELAQRGEVVEFRRDVYQRALGDSTY